MTLKQAVLAIYTALHFVPAAYSQCSIPPQTSITGSRCVGSEILINSNILPESVVWERNGSVVSTQTVTLSANAVTVAGGNGAGNGAHQLSNPDRLYVDAAGVIYVPDLANNRIQKWFPNAAANGHTVAGGNGAGSAANQFDRPSSVFVDQGGNIYVTDQNNGRVQKWAPGANTGVTVVNDVSYPTDVFVDKSGNLYVSDQNGDVVKKYAPGATAGTVVGANLNAPTGIFVDDNGVLYVCDTDNGRVVKFMPGSTTPVTIANGVTPLDVSVDCNGNVYVVDYFANAVKKYPPNSPSFTIVAGGNGQGNAPNQLNNPIGVFIVGNNHLYVSDYSNHRVQRFSNSIDPRYTPSQAGNYTVTVNYPCCPSFSENFEIFEWQQPSVNITASDVDICPGDAVTCIANNTNNIVDPLFRWKLNGADAGDNTNVFTSNNLEDKDQLYCILSSQKTCTLPEADTSNSIRMKVFKPVPLQMEDALHICPGTDTLLQAPPVYMNYTWQDHSTQPSLLVNQEGTYYVDVTDVCNNSFSDTVHLSFFKPAHDFLPRDTTICSYDVLTLAPTAKLHSMLWSDQSTASSIITDHAGLYWLQALDEHNCSVGDSVTIQFKTCPPKGIYMPNAFSPNNNGRNEVFKPAVFGLIKNYRLMIYNRYGQLVFKSSDTALGWNGKLNGEEAAAGVYVWMCQYEPEGQKPVNKKGTVVLLR